MNRDKKGRFVSKRGLTQPVMARVSVVTYKNMKKAAALLGVSLGELLDQKFVKKEQFKF